MYQVEFDRPESMDSAGRWGGRSRRPATPYPLLDRTDLSRPGALALPQAISSPDFLKERFDFFLREIYDGLLAFVMDWKLSAMDWLKNLNPCSWIIF
jgi:hypothetical protein